MCGIAGFIGNSTLPDRAERTAVLERMCRVITHRGPDDQGTLVEGEAALGMRRLSIIDVAGGHQPLSGCDDALTIIFNGEIYNHDELRSALEARGHRFRTHSDTEAIIHAYEEYGADCAQHLRGMFAFAIWDARARKLFVARDRTGKKPLFYALTASGSFIFGSELKSLLEHPEVRRETNLEALDAYLTFGYVPDPLCILRGVNKLPPGHHLSFTGGRVALTQYWDFPHEQFDPSTRRSDDDYIEELLALLEEAVRVRLMSEVPLGAFLSGGVDSSAVVGMMARHMGQPVKTFSIGFQEDSFNELKYARVAAKHFATDHHEFVVTPDICRVVDELAWHFDEPFADPSAVPTYMVSKLARQHVTVALSGDGGDELFAGYTRYAVDRGRSGFTRIPRLVRHNLMRPLSAHLPHGARGRNFLHNVSLDPLERYIDSVSVFNVLGKRALYTPAFRAQLKDGGLAAARFRFYAGQVRTNEPLDKLLYLDGKTYLPGDILTKVDRMSMAVSLETRAPLLDHKLIEFAARLPADLKLRGLETKHIFKRAAATFVPAEILHRPKMGFGVPINQWINDQLSGRIRETLTESRTRSRGYVETAYVNRLLAEHGRGRRDHSTQLWSLFMLEQWHRVFMDDATPRPAHGVERLLPVVA
ncbi:MAG TPA: asparagine synthase (glutamine-hydrolyzing) [Pyrinomonadaceae bacterium]